MNCITLLISKKYYVHIAYYVVILKEHNIIVIFCYLLINIHVGYFCHSYQL